MAWIEQNSRRWYHHWAVWTILILCATAFFGWPRLKARYQRWNAVRQVQRAEQHLGEKDFRRAAITARGVLAFDPLNVGATRIIARALEESGSPDAAQWRSRLDSLEPGNSENLIAWAGNTMEMGDLAATERVLNMVAPGARENATYHEITARLATARQESANAEEHWAAAARLDPAQDNYRLNLASIRMRSRKPEDRAGATAMLRELSEKTPRNSGAIRILLAEAVRQEDWKDADRLSKALVADPAAIFGDKLQRLVALRQMNVQEAPGYLVELRDEALSKPEDLYTLFMWMNENQLSLLVAEWLREFPPDAIEIIGAPPVSVAVADAYARSAEWKKLREFLEDHSWGDFEYLRRAFMARARERLGEADTAALEWKDALSATAGRQDSVLRLERLVNVALSWGWSQRAEDIMWTLAGSPGCSRRILDFLRAMSLKRMDTAQLQKLAGAYVQADAKSVPARNDYAFYSLLVRSEDGNPHREAEKLFNENPADAQIAVTRGLSLFQQGKAVEALAITNGLPTEELRKPQVALYHAIFLTAAGNAAKAEEFLDVAKEWRMFPEEKALLERAKAMVSKAADEKLVAEAAKVARVARAARDAEMAKAVELAKAERAAKNAEAAKNPDGDAEKELAEALKARMAERAARAVEAEAAVAAARAERAAKAAKDAEAAKAAGEAEK